MKIYVYICRRLLEKKTIIIGADDLFLNLNIRYFGSYELNYSF